MPPMTPAPTRRSVVLIEDHTAIRDLLKASIEAFPGYRVVGQAGDVADARELCRAKQPALVVLDLGLPSGPGLSLLAELPSLAPRSRVVVFSANLRPGAVRSALLAGAYGLVEKTAELGELHQALGAAARGQVYLSHFASEAIRRMVGGRSGGRRGVIRLTPREKSVLRGIALGRGAKEIALELGISRHTVAGCRARISRKSGVAGAARLARYAVQLGIVPDSVEGAAEVA